MNLKKLAEEINSSHQWLQRRTVEEARKIGVWLIEAQEQCEEEGVSFKRWVKHDLCFNYSTARHYINLVAKTTQKTIKPNNLPEEIVNLGDPIALRAWGRLKGIGDLDAPGDVAQRIPSYLRDALHKELSRAVAWINEFSEEVGYDFSNTKAKTKTARSKVA